MSLSAGGKNVLIVGPGFIGWNVLDHLVREGYNVTGLVRRASHGQQIEFSGAKAVVGDLNDTTLIKTHAAESDIIFHTATADHKPSAEAVCQAVAERAAQGKSTIYIHTSGTSVLDDGACGEFKGDKVYHDNNRAEIDSVPDDAPHRQIDLTILKYQKEIGDKAKIAIMIPPLIYGYNPQHRRLTIQIPTLTRFAIKHGFAGYLGKGLPVESQIHVLDLAQAYVTLLHHMENTPAQDFLDNPYFFCENGREASWREVAEMIGEGLHKAGKIQDPTPKTIPKDLWGDLFGEFSGAVIGLNSRSRAVRLRELGWEPTQRSMEESFQMFELAEILKEDVVEFHGYAGTAAS
ncbi:hypothetical protein Z517_11492 [Fonsecaea pedrosoi CBS 271.37]|uniref:Unplaced genomic scaffold supercont1.8, whole genome shotgun sequence n=1 Tax=Fonsecaea pedrosoi CBS 271.37 TaxID=1442368 RepID=A0A0D2EJZ1_9EURO|nr:uncharacterized protein Z517_11492 [Fonsecaea pedrosoi CBS 271.37]KIW74722.1 hypothetical protein Z517_11492 [Fonsecaea pedrosoi CBS 271.37]